MSASKIKDRLQIEAADNQQYPLPDWFIRYLEFGIWLEQVSKDNTTKILGCLITPEPLVASLAIATGVAISHRMSGYAVKTELKPGDCVFLDNKRARFVSSERRNDQILYRFEESLDKKGRKHSPVEYLVPEVALRDRVVIAAPEDSQTWLGYRRREGNVGESSLEVSLFGEGSRVRTSNTAARHLMTISGNRAGLDRLAEEMHFSSKNSKLSFGAVYDILLPGHYIPPGVAALTEVKSRTDDTDSTSPIALLNNPREIDQVTSSTHAIALGIIGSCQVRALELCHNFVEEYQVSDPDMESLSATSIASLPKGIPAAFFGKLQGNQCDVV